MKEFMKENGLMTKEKAMVLRYFLMEMFIMVITDKGNLMEKEFIPGQMVKFMMVNG